MTLSDLTVFQTEGDHGSRRIRGGQSDNGTGFSLRTSVFFHQCSILIPSSITNVIQGLDKK